VSEERIAKLEGRVESLKSDFEKSNDLHEGYRDKVHERLNQSHTMFNREQLERMEADNRNSRRIDSVEHSVQTIDKIVDKVVDKFESFGREVTNAITKLEKTVEKNSVQRSTEKQTWKEASTFLVKLAAFALTIIGILKYVGVDNA